jgi:hypothetical protein
MQVNRVNAYLTRPTRSSISSHRSELIHNTQQQIYNISSAMLSSVTRLTVTLTPSGVEPGGLRHSTDRTAVTIQKSKRLSSVFSTQPYHDLQCLRQPCAEAVPLKEAAKRPALLTTHHNLVRSRYGVYSYVSLLNTQLPRHANRAGEQGVKNKASRPSSFL